MSDAFDVTMAVGQAINVTVSGSGPEGPIGPTGPTGPQGLGVLVLSVGDPVPPGTPPNTVIFRAN